RSLYQLHLMEADDTKKSKPYALQREPQGEFDIGLSHPDRRRPYPGIPLNQSSSTLSFSMLNCTPPTTSPYQWASGMPDRTPDSVVGSNEMGHFSELTSDSQAQECVSKRKPVAKPRQRRLKRTKSTSATPISPPVSWINTNMLEDRVVEDRTDRSQWGAFRHLPVTTEVTIDRTPQGFGFSIAGGWDDKTGSTEMNTGIHVTRVLPGGAAERDGGLRLGDRILSVNGISLVGVSHEEAVHALQLAGSRLKLVIERRDALSLIETMESPIVSSYRLHTSKSTDRNAVAPSVFSAGPQTNANGSVPRTGSAGAMSMSSAGLTNTSLVSGSLFDHGTSKQILTSSSGVHSAERVRSTPPAVHRKAMATEMSDSNATAPAVMLGHRQKVSGEEQTKKAASVTVMSAPGYRRNRRAITTSGYLDGHFTPRPRYSFPAFSWCTGLHKTTGCAALLGGNVQRGPTSHSASGRRSPSEPHQKPIRTRTGSGSRPVPPPSPGPVVVEVVLIRGTRSGLGFSIAGGVGNETVDGDCGIFVTKVRFPQNHFFKSEACYPISLMDLEICDTLIFVDLVVVD
ncbi:uncharacterized protein DEA37_0002540, partial [Paragonimus westermani]